MKRWTNADTLGSMLEHPKGEFYAVEDVHRDRDEREGVIAHLRGEIERLELLLQAAREHRGGGVER